MRIVVIGAGSMGSVFGGKLMRAGAAVTLYDIDQTHIDAIRKSGLTITAPDGTFTVNVEATSDIASLSEFDLALVLVDSSATLAIARLLPALLSEEGAVLTLQNGIGNVEALAAVLGASRVLGGSTFVSAAMIAPGHAHHTNTGETVLGESCGGLSARATAIVEMFRAAGFPAGASGNAMGHIWSKFALNCALAPLSALTGLRPGEVIRTPAMASLLEDVIAEILAVVAARSITLPEADPAQHIRDHAWLRYNRPSMLQHLEAGRPTEIGGLNEALVYEAASLGVPVPVNQTLAALVRGIEARHARGVRIDERQLEAEAQAGFAQRAAMAYSNHETGGKP